MTVTGTTPPTPPTVPSPAGTRSIWLALILIVAVLVGGAAGLLTFAGGAKVPTSVLAGGGAFAGTVFLALAVYKFVTGSST